MHTWKVIDEFRIDEQDLDSNLCSHAQLPTPFKISEDTIKIYFASRNSEQFSSVYSVNFTIRNNKSYFDFKSFSKMPHISPGPVGSFDEHGVYPSTIVKIDDVFFMYYIGWNRGYTSPLFYSSIGLAKSEDGSNFTKMFAGPVLARNKHEPFLVTSPFIEIVKEKFRLYFVSGIEWLVSREKIDSRYDIKMIESESMEEWNSANRECVIPLQPGETNIARPWVHTFDDNQKFLYFSYMRSNVRGYRLGVAIWTKDGDWKRLNDEIKTVGLNDDVPLCYPAIASIQDRTFMFINGESYGKTGFYVLELM